VADRPRVFVSRRIPDDGLAPILAGADATVWPDELPPPRDELLKAIKGMDGVLTLLTDRVDAEFLDTAGPQLKVVSNYAVGFDNIVVPEATKRHVAVGNTPGVLTDTTADLAFALLMAAGRRVVEGDRYVHEGRWKTWGPLLLLGTDVSGSTIGIVGFGRIGQAVAKRAVGFGMTVLYHDVMDPPADAVRAVGAQRVELHELFRRADFVTLHTNLTDDTRHMVNESRLRTMKPTAVLINTSRGPVVDQKALFNALSEGWIMAAGLDVTDPEPMPVDEPLLTLPNCIVVPHIASGSRATRGKMAEMAAANLLAGARGQRLPTPVNPEVYDG
jgi:lactate dehydrogenase-like 2-hydroxyacid dehydrogenase